MPTYTKTTWVDEVPYVTPNHYVITGANSDCTIALKDAPTVTGTPLNATNLNKIESQLDLLTKPTPVLIQKIISSGSADEFDFTSIPTGYASLKLVGNIKQTGTGTPTTAMIRFNNDSGNNYRPVVQDTGAWGSYGTNMSTPFIVNSRTGDESIINHLCLTIPQYETAFHKMAFLTGHYYFYSGNPTGEIDWHQCLWCSASVINRIQLFGTYTSTSSWLALYGLPIWG